MNKKMGISRRQFVTSAAAVAAVSAIPAQKAFGAIRGGRSMDSSQTAATLTDAPGWRDQGIENLSKSPHAKLRNIPVHAVTIQQGFWGTRRDVNVNKSIPSMHDLLEANGRMN